jgi:hypothetical protein
MVHGARQIGHSRRWWGVVTIFSRQVLHTTTWLHGLRQTLARVGEADAARQVVARLVGHHAVPERVGHAIERGEEGGVVEGVVVGRFFTASF